MDSHHRRFRAIECHLAGVCQMALADGDLADGTGGDIHPGEQHRADACDAEVLDNHPPARDRGGGGTKAYRRANSRADCDGLSVAEGVCIQSAHRLADMGDWYDVLHWAAF